MLVFISSAYRGPSVFVEQDNAQIAQALCLLAMRDGFTPFASHLLYTQFLDDQNAEHRDMGIKAGHDIFDRCTMVYVYEPHIAHSHGVMADLKLAQQQEKPIRMVSAETLAPLLKEIRPSRLFARIFGQQ